MQKILRTSFKYRPLEGLQMRLWDLGQSLHFARLKFLFPIVTCLFVSPMSVADHIRQSPEAECRRQSRRPSWDEHDLHRHLVRIVNRAEVEVLHVQPIASGLL